MWYCGCIELSTAFKLHFCTQACLLQDMIRGLKLFSALQRLIFYQTCRLQFAINVFLRSCTAGLYSRTPLFQTRLIQSPRYFEGRSNSLGFTLPLYASLVISKPWYFKLFSISLGTSKQRGSTVHVCCNERQWCLFIFLFLFQPLSVVSRVKVDLDNDLSISGLGYSCASSSQGTLQMFLFLRSFF